MRAPSLFAAHPLSRRLVQGDRVVCATATSWMWLIPGTTGDWASGYRSLPGMRDQAVLCKRVINNRPKPGIRAIVPTDASTPPLHSQLVLGPSQRPSGRWILPFQKRLGAAPGDGGSQNADAKLMCGCSASCDSQTLEEAGAPNPRNDPGTPRSQRIGLAEPAIHPATMRTG